MFGRKRSGSDSAALLHSTCVAKLLLGESKQRLVVFLRADHDTGCVLAVSYGTSVNCS